jgi:hypothetical protein
MLLARSQQPTLARNEAFLAYVAGLFDGEGCIHYSYKKHCSYRVPSSSLWMQVSSTNQEVVEWLRESLGGFIFEDRSKRRPKTLHNWKAGPRKTFEILKLLLPYLRIKRKQAELILANEAVISKIGVRPESEKAFLRALSRECARFSTRPRREHDNFDTIPLAVQELHPLVRRVKQRQQTSPLDLTTLDLHTVLLSLRSSQGELSSQDELADRNALF